MRHARPAFTLLDLLVVVVVIATLLAVVFLAVNQSRESARREQCENNLKQHGLGCINFLNANKHFPPGGKLTRDGRKLANLTNLESNCHYDKGSWIVQIAPFEEQTAVYDKIPDKNYYNPKDGDDPRNNSIGQAIKLGLIQPRDDLRCPSDETMSGEPVTSYVASMGPQCMWQGLPEGGYGAPICSTKASAPYEQYCKPETLGDNTFGYTASSAFGTGVYPPTHELGTDSLRGLFGRLGGRMTDRDVVDGFSNTILLGETISGENAYIRQPNWIATAANSKPNWATGNIPPLGVTLIPINFRATRDDGCSIDSWRNANVAQGFKSRHPGGAMFIFADGSSHFISESIDHRTYQILGCRSDRQVPPKWQ